MVGPIQTPRPISPASTEQRIRQNQGTQSTSFDSVLSQALQRQEQKRAVKFSGHAQERLRQRQIMLSPDKMKRLETGIEKASQKGAKESLILMDDIAMIVSVKNNTIITAASGKELKDNVFTNIDSAVIV